MDETPGVSRRRLLALLGAGTAGLAGCATPFDTDDGTPQATDATATTGRPYEADQSPTLPDPGGFVVENFDASEQFLTVVVTRDEREVFVDSRSVPAGGRFTATDLLGDPGDYRVVVETAAGVRRTYEWTVTAHLPHLWIGLTPDPVFRRPFQCLRDCRPLASVGTAPPAAFERDDDRPTAVWLDNRQASERSVRLRIADGDEDLFVADYTLPREARAVVPVSRRRRTYRVTLETADTTLTERWQPRLRRRLYAAVDGGPQFRCGLVPHDLVVSNETDATRTTTVAVTADGANLLDREFTLGPETSTRLRSAVDPRGPLSFLVTTDDGRRERYDWGFCAPRGPISVTVGEAGISVAVTPAGS
jgi:hypothetical protein